MNTVIDLSNLTPLREHTGKIYLFEKLVHEDGEWKVICWKEHIFPLEDYLEFPHYQKNYLPPEPNNHLDLSQLLKLRIFQNFSFEFLDLHIHQGQFYVTVNPIALNISETYPLNNFLNMSLA